MASCQSLGRKKHEKEASEKVQTDVQKVSQMESYEKKAFSDNYTFSQWFTHSN